MPVGQIPATMLTHLNIAFAYLNSDFQVIPMPGIDSSLYQNIGNIKARNSNIKLSISIGGWTFSDPGSTQAIFPTLVSSEENRATFIRNLLGFLSQYGYDGVGK
jgi:chitinase